MRFILPILLLLAASQAHAAGRVALVIGNNKYANLAKGQQLTSAVNDAKDLAAVLKGLGYTLVSGNALTDANKDEIITATEEFAAKAKDADAAVFYFSGHGIQVGEDNFLMPSDTPHISSYTVLKNRSVHLREAVMVALEEARAKTKVIILDCCRENPFASQVDQALRQVGKSMRTKGGLGEITGYGPGFFLAFATSPTQAALDGNGARNSPFTAALLTHLKASPNDEISALFRKVKALVRKGSGEEQVPWTNDSLDLEFSLFPQQIVSPSAKELFAKANGFFDINEYGQAEAAFRSYLALNNSGPDAITAYFRIGECLSEEGSRDAASDIYRNVLKLYPKNEAAPTSAYRLGSQAFHKRDFTESLEMFAFAAAKSRSTNLYLRATYAKALSLRHLGRNGEAIANFKIVAASKVESLQEDAKLAKDQITDMEAKDTPYSATERILTATSAGKGHVESPYEAKAIINASEFKGGQLAKCPYTGRTFRLPSDFREGEPGLPWPSAKKALPAK